MNRRTQWALWAGAFIVPLALSIALAGRDFELEDYGSCSALTAAGQDAFDGAVLGLQLTLVVWVLAGGVLMGAGWFRGLDRSAGAWVALAGWSGGIAAAVWIAWVGPAAGGIGKALLLLVVSPIIVIVTSLIMAIGFAAHGRPFPVGVLLRSQAVLVAMLIAGSLLGGSGEVELC